MDRLLSAAGLRNTKVRKAVIRQLSEALRPLSHQEIAGQLEAGSVDRVTLYRTLATLEKSRLAHRVLGLDGVWRFCGHQVHSEKCGGNHVHFLCLECDKMSCLPEQPLPWITAPEGTVVQGKQLVVYGRCAECVANNLEANPCHESTSKGEKSREGAT